MSKEQPLTNITQEHREAFEALSSGQYRNFALFSCFADGKPTAAIVTVHEDGGEYLFTPLSIAPPADMKLTNHDEREA